MGQVDKGETDEVITYYLFYSGVSTACQPVAWNVPGLLTLISVSAFMFHVDIRTNIISHIETKTLIITLLHKKKVFHKVTVVTGDKKIFQRGKTAPVPTK